MRKIFIKRKKCNMLPLFPLIHIQHSTFPHQLKAGGPPFSPERETCCMLSINKAMAFLLSLSISSSVMLSFVPTYKYELTLIVGASLRLASRYEPYRLICRWLNVKRPGRCAPWGAQGWILRMAALIKGRLSDNRPEAFAASFQTERIQNICMLPDVLVCFRKTACIFSHYLSQKSSTGPSLLDSTRFRQNVSSPVSLYRPAI